MPEASPTSTIRTCPRRAWLTDEVDRIFTLFGAAGPRCPRFAITRSRSRAAPSSCAAITPHDIETGISVPAHVLLHGGGWSAGSIDELLSTRRLAIGSHCRPVSSHGRIPARSRHRFPTAVHDAVAAVRWVRTTLTTRCRPERDHPRRQFRRWQPRTCGSPRGAGPRGVRADPRGAGVRPAAGGARRRRRPRRSRFVPMSSRWSSWSCRSTSATSSGRVAARFARPG